MSSESGYAKMPAARLEFGRRVRAFRHERGLTLAATAANNGLSASWLGHIERGKRECGLTSMLRIADALDVPAERLVADLPREPNPRMVAGDTSPRVARKRRFDDTVDVTMLEVSAAARELGISVRQVQRLTKAGRLLRVGPDRLDAESVYRLQRLTAGRRGRAWSEATAWAGIAMLSGVPVDWLGQPQRSRLRTRLRSMDAEELVASCRNRAAVHRFTGHRSITARLATHLVAPGGGGSIGALTVDRRGAVDGYVSLHAVEELVEEFALADDAAGDVKVVLRAAGFDVELVRQVAEAGPVLAALDLATSLDQRERSAALTVLGDRLSEFR